MCSFLISLVKKTANRIMNLIFYFPLGVFLHITSFSSWKHYRKINRKTHWKSEEDKNWRFSVSRNVGVLRTYNGVNPSYFTRCDFNFDARLLCATLKFSIHRFYCKYNFLVFNRKISNTQFLILCVCRILANKLNHRFRYLCMPFAFYMTSSTLITTIILLFILYYHNNYASKLWK